MANERLRTALLQRGLTPSDLADTVGVDPKTIERWIGGRIPYRRHRHQVAVRLGVDETYLWPGALAAEQVASASESEILVVHPHRWAVPRDTWGLLFDSAEREIGILVYSGLFIAEDAELIRLLGSKARAGTGVRIALGDPSSPHVDQRGQDEGIQDAMAAKIRNAILLYRPLIDAGVAIRLHSTVLYNSLFRGDDAMLINQHIHGIAAAYAPVLHLRRRSDEGVFSTYLESFERVWTTSTPLDP